MSYNLEVLEVRYYVFFLGLLIGCTAGAGEHSGCYGDEFNMHSGHEFSLTADGECPISINLSPKNLILGTPGKPLLPSPLEEIRFVLFGMGNHKEWKYCHYLAGSWEVSCTDKVKK